MNFLEAAKSRYSVRKFEDRKVEADHMKMILEAANAAPTACNYQPQRIYVIEKEENIEKLNSVCKCIFGAKTVLMFTYSTDEEWKNRTFSETAPRSAVHSPERAKRCSLPCSKTFASFPRKSAFCFHKRRR